MTALAELGVHRDPSAPDPLATATFSQKVVAKASSFLGRRSSRRSFLTRTAVIGSALAVGPIDFLIKPGTAYGYVCGSCSEGWTAFCCTINNGSNTCPPNSFVAGWWKADNAAYCCGAARYIIDCNATCPTKCNCHCSGTACDDRRVCCNQFRYGQCHQEISCYGPVVCRVATCTPPWIYDPSCTTASATDNRTVNHGAPCLGTDCGTDIERKYKSLGGATGWLGPVTITERPVGDGRGRYAKYTNGSIYWTATTGAHEVHGAIFTEWVRLGNATGTLKYPTSDTGTTSDGKRRYSNFEGGRIYYQPNGKAYALPNPYFTKHQQLGGGTGMLGYPTSSVVPAADPRGNQVSFDRGRIYAIPTHTAEIHGAVFTHHEATGGVTGPLKFPVADLKPVGDNIGKAQWFEGGIVFYTATTGAFGQWGKILDRYAANGNCRGYLGYPTSSPTPVGDGQGLVSTFQKGNIYASTTTDGHQVHGAVLTAYLTTFGGPTGALGYPTSELDPPGTVGGRFQQFQNGRLQFTGTGTVVQV